VKGKKFCEEFKHQDACIDDCCEKPVKGKLVTSKLVRSEEKPVKGKLGEKPVKGELVKSRTYSQVVKDLDEDGFKLVMSKKEERDKESQQPRHQDARRSQECGGSARVGGPRNGSRFRCERKCCLGRNDHERGYCGGRRYEEGSSV